MHFLFTVAALAQSSFAIGDTFNDGRVTWIAASVDQRDSADLPQQVLFTVPSASERSHIVRIADGFVWAVDDDHHPTNSGVLSDDTGAPAK